MEQQHGLQPGINRFTVVKTSKKARSAAKVTQRRSTRRTVPAGIRSDAATQAAALHAERDRALELARTRAEFISHASHEIRTPLHGIVGYATLLLGTELSDEQRSFANALRTGVESLLSVVSDVLDVSRLDAGALALEKTGFDLVALVLGVTRSFQETASSRGLSLSVDTHALAHPNLVGDPGRIRQVLVNLVANAVKFTDAGSVVVRAETSRMQHERIALRLSVTDTGPGIPAAAQRRLFQPFSRLGTAGAASKPGTGLGLAISKQLVELMGGTLQVDSAPRRGSTFAFELHLPEDLRPAAQRELDPFDVSCLRVYVADDDGRSRRDLLLSLASAGIGVAMSGAATPLPEALRSAREAGTLPDLAIVGHVDHADGDLAIARAVRADPRLAGVKLVLAPVAGMRGRAREAHDAGYDGYVSRPFGHAELLRCTRAVATRSFNGDDDGASGLITRHTHAAASAPIGGRVLIADDDAASRHVTRLQVERLGFTADDADSGKAAVAAAARRDYDVILMDCQMADMDGLAAAAEIRRGGRTGHRPAILAMTADVSAGQRERCRRAGLDDFLEKPVRTQLLAGALARYARRVTCTTSAGPASEVSPVDRSAVDLLEADIGSELTIDLVREYLEGAEQTIDLLERERLDAPAASRHAHRLLGGARILGLAPLERLWQTLADDEDGVPPATIDDLRRACAELRGWVQAHQGNQHV